MKYILILLLLTGMMYSGHALSVVIPEKADAVTLNAADELVYHLGQVMKKKIPIVREGSAVTGAKIFLGATAFAQKNGVKISSFGMEDSLIRSCGKDLIICGGFPRGTLYGVYEFLERFAGVAWLDPFTTVIPKNKKWTIPAGVDRHFTPSFRFRGVYSITHSNLDPRTFQAYLKFRSRMRDNVFWAERITDEDKARWGITPVLGSPAPLNTLYFYVKDWPEKGMEEAFSLDKNGDRLRPLSKRGPGHICFSSKLARETFAKQMKEFIRRDREKNPQFPPLLYNLSINDTPSGNCVCVNCKALVAKYGSSSGAMLEFVNYVAEEVVRVYPDIRIQTSAYFFTSTPPVGIKPHPAVSVRVSPIDVTFDGSCYTMKAMEHKLNEATLRNIAGWSRIGKIQIWNYWVNYGTQISNAGIVNIKTIWQNLRLFKKHGADYVFSESEFPHLTSFHPLRIFVGYRMKNDCTQSLDELLKTFFKGYYGRAAEPMRKLYDYIEQRQQEHPDLSIRTSTQLNYLDPAFFKTAERYLADARKLAGAGTAYWDRVMLEQNVLDLARLELRDNWKQESDLPDAAAVRARLRKNIRISCRRWAGKNAKFLNRDIRYLLEAPVSGTRYPLPDELKKRNVFELSAKTFTNLKELKRYGVTLENDPDAPAKQALVLRKVPKRHPHNRELVCGIQSRSLKKGLLRKKIRCFADEKYHFYHLGKVTLTPLSLLWLHSSWAVNQSLDRFYRSNGENCYDIYISLKAEGPVYAPDSKKENAIFLDRIILAPAK